MGNIGLVSFYGTGELLSGGLLSAHESGELSLWATTTADLSTNLIRRAQGLNSLAEHVSSCLQKPRGSAVNEKTTEAKILLEWRFGTLRLRLGTAHGCQSKTVLIEFTELLTYLSSPGRTVEHCGQGSNKLRDQSLSTVARQKPQTCLVNLDISSPTGEFATNSIYELH